MLAFPEKNLIICTLGSYEGEIRKVQDTYFFRLTLEENSAVEEVLKKVLELNTIMAKSHGESTSSVKSRNEGTTITVRSDDPRYFD